jgi:hypothetical protein
MASLAGELASRGKTIKDPYKEHIERSHAAGLEFEDLEEAEDHDYSDDDQSAKSEGTAYTDTEESKQQVSFAAMPSKKATASPSSAMKRVPTPRKLAGITGAVGAPIANGIAAPIVQGCFQLRDTETRKRHNHYHIRMLWNNFVTADDIEYDWIDDRTLKVSVYDPGWWSDPEYQAAFDSEHGTNSNLIESMIDFQEERKQKVDGQDKKRTANTGFFVFDEPMSIKEEDDTAVIPQTITHNSIAGMYIVVKVRVAPDDLAEAERTPRKGKKGGVAQMVGTGKNFANVRQREDDDEMSIGGSESEEEDVPPPSKRTFNPSSQHLLLGPPPIIPQSSLQITAAADAAASKTITDGSSMGSIQVDGLGIEEIPQEEFVDDNQDLASDF